MLTAKIKELFRGCPYCRLFTQYIFILILSLSCSLLLSATLWNSDLSLTHTLMELLCIFIALSAFLVVWITFKHTAVINRTLGFGFLAVAIFDMFHAYYFPSLNRYPSGYYDLTVRYWIAGRLVEALILLLSTYEVKNLKINRWIILLLTVFLSLGISLMILKYPNSIPLLLDSREVRPIRIFLEYVIISTSLLSFYRIQKRLNTQGILTYKYIGMAILLIIPAELCFTLYQSFLPPYNAIGHTLKLACYYYLFKGIFSSAITYPYETLRKTKNELEESKNELKDILNGLSVALITYDKNSNVSFANVKAVELLECEYADIYGLTVDELHQKFLSNPAISKDIISTCESSENMAHAIQTYRTLKGKEIVLNENAIRYKNGTLVSLHDVTKEQELSNLKIQTSTILNSLSNQVLMTDSEFTVIMLNKALTDCLEMEYDEIAGMELNKLYEIIQLTVDHSLHKVDKSTLTLDSFCEGTLVTPKGNRKTLLFHYSSIVNIDDKIIGHIGIFSDITALKEEQSKIQQQEKLALIGQMGSGIVHETKNHLASVKGYCQLLSSKLEDEQLKVFVRRIESVTTDVNKVITDFLSLAKPSQTMMDICSINEIIEAMRYMLESPSFVKGVHINIELCHEDNDIKADESQLKQIILNLTKNAIEALADKEDALLYISTRYDKSRNEMQLSISDNGKGIAEEDLKRIGTPFFTTKETGTGLGLSVCYRIIKEHGGRIDVRSEKDKGTTFIVSFPCYDMPEECIA